MYTKRVLTKGVCYRFNQNSRPASPTCAINTANNTINRRKTKVNEYLIIQLNNERKNRNFLCEKPYFAEGYYILLHWDAFNL